MDATGGGLWSTTQLYKATVPAGKRWLFLGGIIDRSDAATCAVTIRNDADKNVFQIDDYPSATTVVAVPSGQVAVGSVKPLGPYFMDAGWYFNISFSVAQGAAAYVSMAVLEFDM